MRPTYTPRRGTTLAEVTVTSALLGLMLLAAGAIYKISVVAMSKTTAQSEMLAEAQVAAAKLSREVATSSFDSLTVTPDRDGACFLVRYDEAGRLEFDIDGRPLWQSYVIYFFEDATLKRRVIPLPAESPIQDAAPIEKYKPWGSKPLTTFLGMSDDALGSVTTPVTSGIDKCTFQTFSGRLSLTLAARKQRLGKTEPETLELTFITMFRNRR